MTKAFKVHKLRLHKTIWRLLRMRASAGDMRWCIGALLHLVSDSCIEVKVVISSPLDWNPGDAPSGAEPSSLHRVLVEASSDLVWFKAY